MSTGDVASGLKTIWLLVAIIPSGLIRYLSVYSLGVYSTTTVVSDTPVGVPSSVTCMPCESRKLPVR